ncbi:MAG: hypothetical protein ACYTGG_08760 [Planctomycetota bacterium]|jgi:Tfp pilus assembly protein PilO
MSGGIGRELIAQAVIIVAACLGGWAIFVQPKIQEINRLEAIVARSAAMQELMDEKEIEAIARRISTFKSRVRWIRDSGLLARDTSRLYELIMNLAMEHGVVVQNLRSDVKSDDSTSNRVHVTDIHITIVGEYESMAAFFDALESVDGLIRSETLNLTPIPAGDQRIAQARLSCQALAFTLPDALAEFLGDEDGDS